jgi:hypothetical protein
MVLFFKYISTNTCLTAARYCSSAALQKIPKIQSLNIRLIIAIEDIEGAAHHNIFS